jgi:hypothetical protein
MWETMKGEVASTIVGSLLRELWIEETNGIYWVMGIIGDMPTEMSMIFGLGGVVRPDRLGAPGAVLLWSD